MQAIKALCALKMTKTDPHPVEIIEGLYIGSIGAAMKKENLKAAGITHIV